jgi:hypothetical protein
MIAELRTYVINGGMLDSYLNLFNKQLVPNHAKYGIKIIGCWIDRKNNEVSWIRVFDSLAQRKEKLDVYEVSPERDEVFPIAAYHMAKADVKILEDVFAPSATPDTEALTNDMAQKAMAAHRATDPKVFAALKASTAAPR